VEKRVRTVFTERGLTVRAADGTDTHVDVFAGAMHYWRLDPGSWRVSLRAMKALGLDIVQTYVPWGVHEVNPGELDWSDEYDLGAFLDAVSEIGMRAIVRPGPHINAELTYFGFPERVLTDQTMLARSARDTPVWLPAPPRMFPVPSYASRSFRRAVLEWYAAVGEIVAPRCAPDGPVVAVQVDNEMQMFFRLGAYDHDYHPDALDWWNDYSGGLEAPRAWDPSDPGRCARWVAFKDEYTARALSYLTDGLRAAGIEDVALFHNAPPSHPSHTNLPRIAAACGGVAGMDFYHRASDYERVRQRALYVTGSSELPFAPEVGLGGPPWLMPMSEDDQKNVILGMLAAGIRAMSFYMVVDRDRWYGAPIAADGKTRGRAAWLRALLSELSDLDWTSLRRHVPIGLVMSRTDARFASASSFADPLTPVITELLDIGPAGMAELSRDADAASHRRWFSAVERALGLAQIPYEIVDEDCSVDRLSRYHALVVPTLTRTDRAAWDRIAEAAAAGTIVVVGPETPTRDEVEAELGVGLPPKAGLIRAASIADLDGFADDLAGVAGELPDEWSCEDQGIDCSMFAALDGTPRVVFVGNSEGRKRRAGIVIPTNTILTEAITGTIADVDDAIASVALDPYQVRMFVISDS
jgi:beta-galactosidase